MEGAMIGRWIVCWVVIVAAVACCVLPGEALAAESFVVNSASDAPVSGTTTFCATGQTSGNCTLRAAIQELNALGGGPHTITLPARTYTLTQTGDDDTALNGDLDITANITIVGDGAASTIVQACNVGANPDCTGIDRVFDVRSGGTLTMRAVTVRKGNTSSTGGGIRNRGTLILRGVVLDRGTADGGGGLENIGAAATATLTSVSVVNNRAGVGGGIENFGGTLSLTNVTLSDNTATILSGGGLRQSGGGSLLSNVTAAGNGSPGGGGIVVVDGGTVTMRNSIIASNTNTTTGGPDNCITDVSGTFNSQGFNLVFPVPGCGNNPNDLQGPNVDPKLGPLQANGGQVPTHALLPGSPAIDGGLGGSACPATDARGIIRPADGRLTGSAVCDIGAYELASFVVNANVDADDASPGNLACAVSGTGLCTLRAAIREANAQGGAAISLPATNFTLLLPGANEDLGLTGDLDITGGITIQGPNPANTIIQACNADFDPNCPGIDRVFEVHPSGRLTLSGVTVRKGRTSGFGGGIENQGTVVLTNAVLDGNLSVGSRGGGLHNDGPAAAATLIDVTVSNNQASGTGGGGIDNFSGVLSLTNVTISGNAATAPGGEGGGLAQVGGSPSSVLANVTIAGNTAGLQSGGISVLSGTITLRNSIVANNTPSFSNCRATAPGTFASKGFNLVFPGNSPTTSCGLSAGTNDLINADPKLGPLRDNGGGMSTMALLAGSAALDAGNPATPNSIDVACAVVDQRGIIRPQDGDLNLDGTARCDIGAFEARLSDLCAQRPLVQLAATRNGQGGLSVTVTRGLGRLTELRFHAAATSHVASPNALVDIGGQVGRSGEFTFTPPTAAVSQQFTVRPANANAATTLPLDAVDACGAWSTLVGGGGGALSRVGTFTVAGLGPRLTAGQTALATFGWALPAPRRWRELASLELRLTDAAGVAWGVRWTEAGDAFIVTDTRTPGLFELAGPHTQGSGPTGPSVTLTLPLQVLPAAAGRAFTVEVRATDDAGVVQGFEPAGTLSVAGASAPTTEVPTTQLPSTEVASTGTRSEEQAPRLTRQQRWQHAHTNAGSPEDARVEGNVVAVDHDARPPMVTIADRDGLVMLLLRGDAANVPVQIGDYVSARGEKVTEQLYEIDDLAVD
jgi:CSLREA domain-containing protein